MQITLEQLEYLSSKGIIFSIPGRYDLTSEQVIKWLRSEDECMADLHGVSVEKYRIWNNCRALGCTATTKKNRQCKNIPRAFFQIYMIGPSTFEVGYHDRCPHHGGPTDEDLHLKAC